MREHAFAGEFDVSYVGDHGSHFGPNGTIEVHFKHAVGFEFEETFSAVFVSCFLNEAVYRVFIHGLGWGCCLPMK